jgi:prepilin signal peptidase PulO-like enzyme (type II secretory pathway)
MEVIYYNIGLISMILLGMVSGSFITMASYRLSVEDRKKMDLLMSPSSCPKCNHQLGALNLVPIFSWIFQKGCCAFCRGKISARYPLIELISTLSFVAIYYALGENIDAKLVIALLIFVTLFIMIITDLEHYFISDVNQFILFILIAFYHFFITFKNIPESHGLTYYLISSFLYLLFGTALHFIFKYFTNQDGIGIDDIKFFAIAGFALGIGKFSLFMFLSGILGIIFGLVWQKIKEDDTFPFAPALVVSFIISLVINFDQW